MQRPTEEEIMGRRYFGWSSLAFAVLQIGLAACNRDGRDRRNGPQSGIVSRELGRQEPAIGGGPRSVEDGGASPLLEDLDPGTSDLQNFDSGTSGMTTGSSGMTTGTTGTGSTGTDTTGTGTATTGTGTTTGTGSTGTTSTGSTGTTGTGTTGTGTTGTS